MKLWSGSRFLSSQPNYKRGSKVLKNITARLDQRVFPRRS